MSVRLCNGGIKIFATNGGTAVFKGLILRWGVDCRLSPKKIILRYLENLIFFFFFFFLRGINFKVKFAKNSFVDNFPK